MFMKKIFLIICTLLISLAQAQMPYQPHSSKIFQQMKKLNVLGNVLYLAAHPDDENTRFISYCANEKLMNATYLSLTRGDGGQNLIGPEISEELGIIRTQELLNARRIDGGNQFFTRANDFGYSKTPDETLEIWDKNKILADVVWAIRLFKPDIIVCRFPTDGGGGHGHHTASALLAEEAFEIAGDKNKFPEQLQWVDVWKPARVVTNTGRWWNDKISAEDEGVVAENIGNYNPFLGMSYNELAARSRTMHKSQGFGSTGVRGDLEEFFEHRKGLEAQKSLFDGINQSWSRVNGGSKIEKKILKLLAQFDLSEPELSIPSLINIRKDVEALTDEFWKQTKLKEIDELIFQCAGIYIEAKADEFSKTSGDSLEISFELINRSSAKVQFHSIENKLLSLAIQKDTLLRSNASINWNEQIILPELPISQPYWLDKKGTLGTYFVENQHQIGKPENEPALSFKANLIINNQLLVYTFPLIYKWNDPVKGELYRPFIITPKITATIEQPIYLFSKKETQEIVITLKNQTTTQKGAIEIITPDGWNASFDSVFAFSKKGDELKLIVHLTPLKNPKNGEIRVIINGNSAKAINSIQYDHIPTQVWFPESSAKLVYIDIKKKATKIGYLAGAGDVVPEALRTIGYQVDLIQEADLENSAQYDAILTGIRFFNINERAPFIAEKLMKYVENGGNLIVQYNTRHQMKTQDFAPYPITLSRDRVTEENAKVTFLKPNHFVFQKPNKISEQDFDHWVQERGLYFPDKWDDKYDALISWNDKGEDAKNGALLVAPYGKGYYAYTGISFFRELPAGVSGAYRLLVNLIEMGNE